MSEHRSGPLTGVVVAMPSELRHLLEQVPVERESVSGPWRDLHLTYQGRRLVAVCSEIGMVNAAAATEHLISTHQPARVLNFGCAGAHRRDILPGDVVIGAATVAHGAVHILPDGTDVFPRPETPIPGDVVRELRMDAALVELAQDAAAGWCPPPWPRPSTGASGVQDRAPLVHTGAVGSADIWTQAHARLDLLHGRHQTLCEDMEAAAVAQVCARHGVPFLTIKDISNNEYHVASVLEADDVDLPWEEVGRRAAQLLLRLLERLPS
jgi:adenosylhomocysteine nucleosidase